MTLRSGTVVFGRRPSVTVAAADELIPSQERPVDAAQLAAAAGSKLATDRFGLNRRAALRSVATNRALVHG